MTTLYETKKLKQGYGCVIGCDEVGRACLAGPVVAGAVALDPQKFSHKINRKTWYSRVRDSKLVLPALRKELSPIIQAHALAWGIGEVSEKIIDEINIHHASLLAMRQAVENLTANLTTAAKIILCVDGKFKVPNVKLEQEAVVDGDFKILSVAAASIVAKVYRDNLMQKLHKQYPVYNFAQHKGYATLQHRRMILRHGLSRIHRLSFCGQFTPSEA